MHMLMRVICFGMPIGRAIYFWHQRPERMENNPHCVSITRSKVILRIDESGCPTQLHVSKIGHIMNYGDGWYGVFCRPMYSLAFISSDINYIIMKH
jgi:hypothetical protein